MKRIFPLLLLVLSLQICFAQHQMIIGDCTVTYRIWGSDAATNNNLAGATKVFYVKGKMARVDMIGANYRQSVIYDNNNGTAVILKEIGNDKYMSAYTSVEWKNENKRFEGQTTAFSEEHKTILGYECKKATVKLKDGSSYSVYYTTQITPSVTENPFQFKDIPGLVLEYETGFGGNNSSRITYTATKINFDPVPASRFEIPVSGYRVLKQN